MTEMNKNDVPDWFVYDTQGDLDVEATLAAAPPEWEADFPVSARVPEWFEVCPPEEIDALLREFDEAPAADLEKYTPEQIAQVRENLKKLSEYYAVYRREGLPAGRKALMRCLCYWLSVMVMNEIPVPRDDAKGAL